MRFYRPRVELGLAGRLWQCLTAVLIASALSTACSANETADTGAVSSSQPPSASAAVKATEAFVALTQGTGSATVSWSEHVAYYLGGVRVADLRPEDLPDTLRSCPPGEAEYEGRTCPVSPLDAIASVMKDGADVVVEPGAPTTVGCNKVTIPDGTAGLSVASVRPPEKDRNCFSDFAVTLITDATGKVETMVFTLSGP